MIRTRRLRSDAEFRLLTGDVPDWQMLAGRAWLLMEDGCDLFVFGITPGSLMTGSRMYIYPRKYISKTSFRGWRRFKQIFNRLLKVTGHFVAYVDKDFVKGCRLVRFMGFRDKGEINGMKVFEIWPQ